MATTEAEVNAGAPREDGPDQGRQGPDLRLEDHREGPADRPYRDRQGQEHGGLGPGDAHASGTACRLGVVQFVKGRRETGERFFLERFPDLVDVKVMGEGFTWETQDRERDIAAARAAWDEALRMLADPELHLVILDELNIVLRKDYLPLDEVVDGLLAKRPDLHVVVTGRNAKPELLEAADLVTEMSLVKHPFRSGVKAQLGIEY